MLNVSVVEKDNEGKYYYDHEIKRDCDIVSDFIFDTNNLNVSFMFVIGLNEYKIDDIKEIVLASCLYSQVK